MKGSFLYKYDDPEIEEWFNNQPPRSKSRALDQALNIIIAHYGTGDLFKAMAKESTIDNVKKSMMAHEPEPDMKKNEMKDSVHDDNKDTKYSKSKKQENKINGLEMLSGDL